ncbi:MAG: hypothetical protein R3Y49_01910 [Rikenellaceae bacterium]
MKKINKILVGMLVVFSIIACQKQNNDPYASVGSGLSQHLIAAYYNVVGVELVALKSEVVEPLPENAILNIVMVQKERGEGQVYYTPFYHKYYPSEDDFVVFAKKYNDLNYMDNVVLGNNNSTQQAFGTFDLVALSDYNENYPAGSSLNEIAMLTYATYAPFIDNGYSFPDNKMSEPEGDFKFQYMRDECFIYYERPLGDITEMRMPCVAGLGGRNGSYQDKAVFAVISFKEMPNDPIQEFELTVTQEDGTVLTDIETVDFDQIIEERNGWKEKGYI